MISPGGLVATLFKASTAVAAAVDAYFGYVSLLVNGETPVAPFTKDASTNNLLVTPVGSVRNDAFSPFAGSGNYSVAFNGTTDYLVTPSTSALNFGTNVYTVEGWFCWTSLPANSVPILDAQTSGAFNFYWNGSTSKLVVSDRVTNQTQISFVPVVNVWYHIAVVRDNTNNIKVKIYINGTLTGTPPVDSANYATASVYNIGGDSTNGGTWFFPGYISNLRVVNGTSVYTGNFTPPTAPLTAITNTVLLTCQSSRFVDNSSTALAITAAGSPKVSSSAPFAYSNTNGAGYFNGTTDYLTAGTTASDFMCSGTTSITATIEAWIYPTSVTANGGATNSFSSVLSKGLISGSTTYWNFGVTNTSGVYGLRFYWYNGQANYYNSTASIPLNAWTHIAVVINSSTVTFYVNGVVSGSGAYVNPIQTAARGQTEYVGIEGATSYKFAGYISNARITNAAVYTSAFTPSATPLTAITNTSLLTLQSAGPASTLGIIDSSTNDVIIAKTGTPMQGTFSPFSQSGWSGTFNGTTDYLTVPQSTSLAFGTADFTIEAWANFTSAFTGDQYIISIPVTGGVGHFGINIYNTGWRVGRFNDYEITGAVTMSLNTWNHIALVRTGGFFKLYVNGALFGSLADGGITLDDTGIVYIGRYALAATSFFGGSISNLRIVKGTAVYTSAFTPSKVPLTAITGTSLLTLQSNRFKDNSTNNLAITPNGTVSIQAASPFEPTTSYNAASNGGSTYFNGSADLNSAVSPAWSLAGSTFTVEAWIYVTGGAGTYRTLLGRRNSGACSWQLTVSSSNVLNYYDGTSYVTTQTIALNTWYHVALVRNGTTMTVYCNGVSVYSGTLNPNTNADTAPLYIGSNGVGTEFFLGYMSDIRIVKGTAVYTTAFTPPTAPLTAITNTQLLLSGANNGIIDYAGKNDIQSVGSVQVTSSKSKYGSNSLYFNGTTDYLVTPGSTRNDFTSGDVTMECWINLTAFPANGISGIMGTHAALNDTNTLLYVYNTGANLGAIAVGKIGSNELKSANGVITAGTWYHVAVVRFGASTTIYVNGVNVATVLNATTNVWSSGSLGMRVGYCAPTNGWFWNGYMDDVRITNGYARYTGGFTVPTQAYGDSSATDPYFNNVSLLLHADGTSYTSNAYNNNTFVDSSANANALTRSGTATQGTFSPFSNSGWSGYFNGSSDYLTIPANSAFALPGNFTVECWFNTNTTGTQAILDCASAGAFGFEISSTVITAYVTVGTSFAFTTTVPLNVWNHIALVRIGTTLTCYLNGVSVGTATTSVAFTSPGTMSIGRNPGGATSYFSGYLSNLRIVNGTAVYTSAFTPSATPLTAIAGTSLLTLQSNRFVDTSATNAAITVAGAPLVQPTSPFTTSAYSAVTNSGSMYFNGSSDYLNIATGNNIANLGTVFTIEMWVYPTAYNSSGAMFSTGTGVAGSLEIGFNGTTSWGIGALGVAWRLTSTTLPPLNQWSHIAAVRLGLGTNQTMLFLNGAVIATGTVTDAWTTDYITYIGSASAVFYYGGYISNLRVTKGNSSLYTSAFTPPTAPLTATTNTVLLLNAANGGVGIVDGTGKNDIVTVGSAATQSSVVKYGTGAIKFNGSTDYLTAVDNPSLRFNTGDFTIEAWIYPLAVNAETTIVSKGQTSLGWAFETTASGKLQFLFNTSAFASTTSVAANTWTHVVVQRSGTGANNVKFFINGVQDATTGTVADNFNTADVLRVGEAKYQSHLWNGYIDDLRITTGYARYTSNFTAPTVALPNSSTGDAYFNYNSLLLQGDLQSVTTKVAKNNVFVDSSASALAITPVGTPTQGTFTPFDNNNWSGYFNGTTDYITSAYTSGLQLGTNNFTIEMYIYFSDVTAAKRIAGGDNPAATGSLNWSIVVSGGTVSYALGTTGSSWLISGYSIGTVAVGQWYHLALVRNGNTFTPYLNGVAGTVYTNAISLYASTYGVTVGGYTGVPFSGYVSNFRYVNGTAVYTSNFTPSTAPLTAISGTQLLTLQSSRFSDNSANKLAITVTGAPSIQAKSPFAVSNVYSAAVNGGSMYFNGTTDYLAAPSSCAITGDFTIEAWIYPTSLSNANIIMDTATTSGYTFYTGVNNTLNFTFQGVGTISSPNNSLVTNAWQHVAISRSGSATNLFINGAVVATSALTTTRTANLVRVGAQYTNTAYFPGYLSNVRMVSSAVYTSAFTPSTTPLTAIANTQLLLSGNTGGIIDTSGTAAVILNGNTQSSGICKFGTGAITYNGGSDYAYVPGPTNNPSFAFGTGDFTIECWVNIGSYVSAEILDFRPASTNGLYPLLGITNAGLPWFIVNSTPQITSTIAVPLNTWTHIAVSRANGVTRLLVGGVLTGTTYADTNNYLVGANRPFIGGNGFSAVGDFIGQLDDVRITKGYARYAGAFTPPTAALAIK